MAVVADAVKGHGRAVALIERFGQPALLLSWVPIIGDAIVVVAGGIGVPFLPFSVWVVAGKLARYAAVAWLGGRSEADGRGDFRRIRAGLCWKP